MCFKNGQRGGLGLRKVERLEVKKMYDVGAGSEQSRFDLGCYRRALRVPELWISGYQAPLRMLQVIQSRRMSAKGGGGHGLICWVEQPARQRVREFQVQPPPGSTFSLAHILTGTVNYRWTPPPSGAFSLCKIAPSGVSKFGGMVLVLT